MTKLYNLARMTTATTGTGTITLGSAVSGYLTFALAGVSDGDIVSYAIRDGANSEAGYGTYTVSGPTLTLSRTVLKSTNSDAAISLSGSAEVMITALAGDIKLVNSSISPTTANVSAAAGYRYFADISGLTADRNFVLPTCQVGDEIELKIAVGDATYELVIIGDTGVSIEGGTAATEWRKTKLTGEAFRFVADGANSWRSVGIIPPGAEMDYVEFTSNVTPTATTEATANTVVTGSAVNFDGSTPVLIEFFANNARPRSDAGGNMTFWLYEDGSSIGQIANMSAVASGGDNSPVHAVRRITPTAGSHTYSIRASVNGGTGLVAAGAGGAGNAAPGFIRITRANP